jgi:hypothetical protein
MLLSKWEPLGRHEVERLGASSYSWSSQCHNMERSNDWAFFENK